ncbi:hypothetical protein ACFOLC_06075 [Lysobacter cavernae]|uniref:DUF3955 domain-containing protein n=1 Tax=Lysobacter cavernae TaxID=1685901 RepID=A0ABV7RLR0_9GAMM
MKSSLRLLAGWLCIGLGLALMVLLGLGADLPSATSPTPILVALLPSVSFGLALCTVGAWLIATRKRP